MNQLECSPIWHHCELTVRASNRLAAINAQRVYVCLEFKQVDGEWIARAYLAPKKFAERIAGKLSLADGITTRLKMEGCK